MRRPLTTRRWFRISLVLGLLVAGYGAVFVQLRTVSVDPTGLVMFEYPGFTIRSYATSRDSISDARWSSSCFPSHLTQSDEFGAAWHFESHQRHGWLYRGFALAERVEIVLRGHWLYSAMPHEYAEDDLEWEKAWIANMSEQLHEDEIEDPFAPPVVDEEFEDPFVFSTDAE